MIFLISVERQLPKLLSRLLISKANHLTPSLHLRPSPASHDYLLREWIYPHVLFFPSLLVDIRGLEFQSVNKVRLQL